MSHLCRTRVLKCEQFIQCEGPPTLPYSDSAVAEICVKDPVASRRASKVFVLENSGILGWLHQIKRDTEQLATQGPSF